MSKTDKLVDDMGLGTVPTGRGGRRRPPPRGKIKKVTTPATARRKVSYYLPAELRKKVAYDATDRDMSQSDIAMEILTAHYAAR
jgi:hypothetical protein